MLPLLEPKNGRLVNVSSTAGRLSKYSPALQRRFTQAKTVAEVDGLMQEFADGVANGTHERDGWISAAYATSKAGLTAATRAFAMENGLMGGVGGGVLVNACCPGWVKVSGELLALLPGFSRLN